MTRPAARVLASPLLPPSRLVLALGRVIGRAASRSARSRGIDSAHEALLAPEGGAAGSDPDAAIDATREAEGELIENVVEFTGTLVREVMTPRTEMISIEEGSNLAELVELAVRTNRSRIVVTRGSVDRIAGMVHVKDLLDLWSDPPRDRGVSAITRPVMSIPESKKGVELLREMQARGAQLAVVVDEHGGTAGLVTIEDLVEELVGEISDEHEVMKPALLVKPDGSALVRGSYPVFDLGARFDVEFPEVEADTVGGFVIALLGRLPEAGDTVLSAGLRLEVVEADRRRVRRVRVTRAAGPVPGAGAASVPNAARDAVDASGTTRESQ